MSNALYILVLLFLPFFSTIHFPLYLPSKQPLIESFVKYTTNIFWYNIEYCRSLYPLQRPALHYTNLDINTFHSPLTNHFPTIKSILQLPLSGSFRTIRDLLGIVVYTTDTFCLYPYHKKYFYVNWLMKDTYSHKFKRKNKDVIRNKKSFCF